METIAGDGAELRRTQRVLVLVAVLAAAFFPCVAVASDMGTDSLRGLSGFRFDAWPVGGTELALKPKELEEIVLGVFEKESIFPDRSARARLQLATGVETVDLSAYQEGYIFRIDLIMTEPAILVRRLEQLQVSRVSDVSSLAATWRRAFNWGFALDQDQLRERMRDATERIAEAFVEDWLEANPPPATEVPGEGGS